MKLHNPFRVATAIDSFPLFLFSGIVIAAAVALVVVFAERYLTTQQIIAVVIACMSARVIYAVVKGK